MVLPRALLTVPLTVLQIVDVTSCVWIPATVPVYPRLTARVTVGRTVNLTAQGGPPVTPRTEIGMTPRENPCA